jgi:hypothetical protein
MQIPIPAQSTSSIAANFDKVLETTKRSLTEAANPPFKAHGTEMEQRYTITVDTVLVLR